MVWPLVPRPDGRGLATSQEGNPVFRLNLPNHRFEFRKLQIRRRSPVNWSLTDKFRVVAVRANSPALGNGTERKTEKWPQPDQTAAE